MNWAHIHLMLNHIPLIGIGFTILLFIIALIRNSNELINVSLIFTIIVALWAIPAKGPIQATADGDNNPASLVETKK